MQWDWSNCKVLAINIEEIAIEPLEESVNVRWTAHEYQQIVDSTEKMRDFEDETFDVIIAIMYWSMR